MTNYNEFLSQLNTFFTSALEAFTPLKNQAFRRIEHGHFIKFCYKTGNHFSECTEDVSGLMKPFLHAEGKLNRVIKAIKLLKENFNYNSAQKLEAECFNLLKEIEFEGSADRYLFENIQIPSPIPPLPHVEKTPPEFPVLSVTTKDPYKRNRYYDYTKLHFFSSPELKNILCGIITENFENILNKNALLTSSLITNKSLANKVLSADGNPSDEELDLLLKTVNNKELLLQYTLKFCNEENIESFTQQLKKFNLSHKDLEPFAKANKMAFVECAYSHSLKTKYLSLRGDDCIELPPLEDTFHTPAIKTAEQKFFLKTLLYNGDFNKYNRKHLLALWQEKFSKTEIATERNLLKLLDKTILTVKDEFPQEYAHHFEELFILKTQNAYDNALKTKQPFSAADSFKADWNLEKTFRPFVESEKMITDILTINTENLNEIIANPKFYQKEQRAILNMFLNDKHKECCFEFDYKILTRDAKKQAVAYLIKNNKSIEDLIADLTKRFHNFSLTLKEAINLMEIYYITPVPQAIDDGIIYDFDLLEKLIIPNDLPRFKKYILNKIEDGLACYENEGRVYSEKYIGLLDEYNSRRNIKQVKHADDIILDKFLEPEFNA